MNDVHQRELEHHDKLYSGFAQQHFAKRAVRMLRAHMVSQILFHTGADADSRVLSLGCGIGDTELVLARYVGEIFGIDLSAAAVRQGREDASAAGVTNVTFAAGAFEDMPPPDRPFDAAIAIFFLHHIPDLEAMARSVARWLRPGGVVYALDPSRRRLSGAVGRVVVPHLMRRYQTPDERELRPEEVTQAFAAAGFEARTEIYDFASSPLAGLLPDWGKTYLVSRLLDDWILRIPGLRSLGSNFQLIARKSG